MIRISLRSIAIATTLVSSFALSSAVFATDPPATLCITAQTNAMHAAAVAQMEKDIAPYAGKTGAIAAIQMYQQELDNAWSALLQPYCGYGPYGTASAVKSYGKSVERARSAFLTASKNAPVPTATTTMIMPVVPGPIVAAAPVKVVATSAVVAVPAGRILIPRGLTVGMRSNAIKELQRRLAIHFGIAPDSGHVTGYFGPITRGLVIRFQIEKKIIASADDEAAGIFGPRTTTAANAMTE